MAVEIINSNKNIKFDCVDTWKGSIEHETYDVITEEKLYNIFFDFSLYKFNKFNSRLILQILYQKTLCLQKNIS